LAFLAYLQYETEEGRRLGLRCLDICRAAGDRIGAGRILNTIGLIEVQGGHIERARRFLAEALEIYRQLGDMFRQGTALNNLGLAAHQAGEFKDAERYFQESQFISQKVGEPYGVALTLYNRGRVAHARGDSVQAKDLHVQSLNIRLEMANPYLSGISYYYLGKAHLALDEFDQARICFYQALEGVASSDNAYVQLQVLTAIAGHLARDERREEALALLRFVLQHPASARHVGDFPVLEEAQALLERIRSRRSSHELDQVEARHQNRTLAEVIQYVLSDISR
jgi:tetratricopeptide (TPR) repeat protein